MAGWFDVFVDGTPHSSRGCPDPQKAVFGPWFHLQREGVDWSAETLRWFDHWLKGIDNGIMEEPSVHYYVLGAVMARRERLPAAGHGREATLHLAPGPAARSIPSAVAACSRATRPRRRATTSTASATTPPRAPLTRTGNAIAHGEFGDRAAGADRERSPRPHVHDRANSRRRSR
ncbi:MAG: hypothetical protein U1E76_03730 [Planctomycetota bacterium]